LATTVSGIALLAGILMGLLGSIPIAGPTAFVVVDSTLDNQPQKALYVAIGAGIAESLYAATAFWGLAALFAKYPVILPISRFFSAAILVFVGLFFVFRRRRSDAPQKRDDSHQRQRNLVFGFGITFLNPTFAATWTAAVAGLHSVAPLRYSPYDALPFGLGVCVGIVAWFWLMIRIMCRFKRRIQATSMDRAMRAIGGALVIAGTFFTVSTILRLN